MSALIDRIFGRKKPSAANLDTELQERQRARSAAIARVQAAGKARADAIAALDKAALTSADEAKLDAERDVTLADHAIAELQRAHAERVKVEAREALEARRERVKARVAIEAADLLDRYDAAAAEVGAAAAAFDEIEAEVEAVNIALHAAGLSPIASATDTHRKAADEHTPERREKRPRWFCRRGGYEVELSVFGFDDKGERVPVDGHGNPIADAERRLVEVVVQSARTRYGQRLPSFRTGLSLPPGRVGAQHHRVRGGEE